MMRSRRWSCFVSLFLGVVLASCLPGCAESDGLDRGSVTGKVTLDGQPVPEGTITFWPTEGTTGPMASGMITAGQYSISASEGGPVWGKHLVKIEWYRDSGKKDAGGAPIMEQAIPPQYGANSTTTVEIQSGANEHNFEM